MGTNFWWMVATILECNPGMSLRAGDAKAGGLMDANNYVISKEDTARKHK